MSNDDHVDAAQAVYDASADEYVDFVGTELSPATEGAIDRSMLVAFVELVSPTGGAIVADIGCGPGRVAAFLAERGLNVVGVDVSTAMVERARIAHPHIDFEPGRLDELSFVDGALAGAVCWYSIIYTPPARLGEAFRELHRVLQPGGHLLLAFQAGADDALRRTDAFGTNRPLTSYRHRVEAITRGLEQAGFALHARAVREPELDHETSPQAFVVVRRAVPA